MRADELVRDERKEIRSNRKENPVRSRVTQAMATKQWWRRNGELIICRHRSYHGWQWSRRYTVTRCKRYSAFRAAEETSGFFLFSLRAPSRGVTSAMTLSQCPVTASVDEGSGSWSTPAGPGHRRAEKGASTKQTCSSGAKNGRNRYRPGRV